MSTKIVDQLEDETPGEGEEFVDLNQPDVEETVDTGEEEATENNEPTENQLPDKFRNKSMSEVVEMYQNLEKEFGRKGNEVGELRKLTDELLQLEIQQKKQNQERVSSQEEDISDDDWFTSPKEATDKYLQKSGLAKEVEQLKEKLTSRDREEAHKAFVEKHPDYKDLAQNEDFQTFVKDSKYRLDLAQKADQYDYEAANELFDMYKAIRGNKGAQSEADEGADKSQQQQQARKKATLEGSSNRSKGTKKVYRRADLIKMKMNDPERYMAMQDEIMQAYADGRVK